MTSVDRASEVTFNRDPESYETSQEGGGTFNYKAPSQAIPTQPEPEIDHIATKQALNGILQKQKVYDKKYRHAMDVCKTIMVHG
jgi:hypothetical protein